MTNAVIGALRVNLGIDTAQFQEGLKNANASLKQFANAAAVVGAAIGAALVAGITAATNRVEKMQSSIRKVDQALSNAGNAAKTSGAELSDWASKLERRTGRAAQEVMDIGANLASFNFGEEVFHRAIELADDMSAAWGGDLKGNLEGLSRALDDPANGFAMLRKRGIALTDTQQAMVEGLMKANDKLGAQKVVLEALEGQVKGVAEAGFQGLTKSLANMASAIEGFFDKIVQSTGFGTMLAAGIDVITRSIDFLTEHLGTIAEYAAVAGGSLALMAAPAILSAIATLTVAIGAGLVGAVRLLTAAIMANPLGALAVGIATAVTAIYHFRDEIQKAIGIDVVSIVKDAANLIINSFHAAYEDIKFLWSNFPDIIGAAVVGAANASIRGVNSMVDAVGGKIEGFINKVVGWLNALDSAFGVTPSLSEIKITGGPGFEEIHNEYADRLAKANSDHATKIQAIMSRDTIGELGKAFTLSTPSVVGFTSSLENLNDEMDDLSGGGKGGKGGKGGGGGKIKQVKDGIDQMAKAMDSAKESLGKGFGDILNGLINKSMSWKDALVSVGQELLKFLNQMNVAQGGSGLFGGGIVQGLLGGLFGFASGGTIMPGGTGGIDSQLVAFRKSPNERVDITKPGQTLSSGAGGTSIYHIDARGADQAAVDRIYRGLQERDKNFGRMVDGRNDTRQLRKGRG